MSSPFVGMPFYSIERVLRVVNIDTSISEQAVSSGRILFASMSLSRKNSYIKIPSSLTLVNAPRKETGGCISWVW